MLALTKKVWWQNEYSRTEDLVFDSWSHPQPSERQIRTDEGKESSVRFSNTRNETCSVFNIQFWSDQSEDIFWLGRANICQWLVVFGERVNKWRVKHSFSHCSNTTCTKLLCYAVLRGERFKNILWFVSNGQCFGPGANLQENVWTKFYLRYKTEIPQTLQDSLCGESVWFYYRTFTQQH